MKKTLYITLSEALELHNRLIDRFGGKPGIRDKGLLEIALMRPQTGYYQSLSLQAAALFQSLALNLAFLDGNKRVAFAGLAIFLKMNGQSIKVSPDAAEEFLIEFVIKRRIDLEDIGHWIEKHVAQV
ncbi:MAG: type II toxin-antitoxin system death-on-curing family toxin [Proteobacteria bacterium]|nr:type II toxin-antitoxin system death-on-curing family toxin [Pseudomonadota bacterium]